MKYNNFIYHDCRFCPDSFTVTLNYSFDEDIFFNEKWIFPHTARMTKDQEEAFTHALKFLHLACGISYYKAFVPTNIILKNYSISDNCADFFNHFFQNGLGEFFYQNNINPNHQISFPSTNIKEVASDIHLPNKLLVPVGGGKDSTVTIEKLKQTSSPITLFSVGQHQTIQNVVDIAQLPYLSIQRKLSPNLFDLNSKGALNGHVPISGIIAFSTILTSILYGFNAVVMSNENSANSGNTVYKGYSINHQWSKSIEFEKEFQTLTQNYILKNFSYFSLLRPYSELNIAKEFSKYSTYHHDFTSCNKQFRIKEKKPDALWCNNCPKCRFVFLILAPFIPKERLINIFGKDLLDDPEQEEGYKELLGLTSIKPFECVGEIEESIAAFYTLSQREEWKNNFLIKKLDNEIIMNYNNLNLNFKAILDQKHADLIPPGFRELI